jgi:hypothetical protein
VSVPAFLETHTAIVGTTGAGKTVTGKGYVEQLLVDGRQVVVLDPTGAWWGMQSNAAGDGPGVRIPIFGGLHANAPIDADDGVRVAELLIDQRVSAILDLSEMDEEEQRAFSLAFISRMRTKSIGNLHLVIDEADELAPELVPDSDAFQLRRALAWIAKRGRIRGFVLTVITQRPADIAKSVLALAQTMVIHRLIAPQDQAPIDRYLKSHADAATRKQVLGSLAGLKRGERWVYSPVESVLERGCSPALTTFDSSAAPIAGVDAAEPQALADVDFAALAEALAAGKGPADPIAEAEATSPRAWEQLLERVARLEEALAGNANMHSSDAVSGAEPDSGTAAEGTEATSAVEDARATARASASDFGALGTLAAIHPAGLTEAAWAARAGYSRKGGAWNARRRRFVEAGWIERRDGRWYATDSGVAAAGGSVPSMPEPGPALVAWWAQRLGAAGRLLKLMADVHPRPVTRQQLAALANMVPTGGAFSGRVAELKAAELISDHHKKLGLAPGLMGDPS